MNKNFLSNNFLSWKAKGILAYLLTRSDKWEFTIDEMLEVSPDGETSFRSGLKELIDNGYVRRYPVKNNDNVIERWGTTIHEEPYGQKKNNKKVADK